MISHLLPLKWKFFQSVDNYLKRIASSHLVGIDEMKMQFETWIESEPMRGGKQSAWKQNS